MGRAHTHTHTAAEMSEEVKEKAAGKSAHRKKKGGKKVKETLRLTWGSKQHGVASASAANRNVVACSPHK